MQNSNWLHLLYLLRKNELSPKLFKYLLLFYLDYSIIRNLGVNYTTSTYDTIIPNAGTPQYHNIASKPAMITYSHWACTKALILNILIQIRKSMIVIIDFHILTKYTAISNFHLL